MRSDDSVFQRNSGYPRRTLSEFADLCAKLKRLPPQPITTIDDSSIAAISAHLSSIAEDFSLMYRPEFVSFICDEGLFLSNARPAMFWLPSLRPPKREWLCSLPLAYLRAGLAYFDINLPLETRFEYADVLLMQLEGRPVEFICDVNGGDGYQAVHALQEDLFDSLASRRASEVTPQPGQAKSLECFSGYSVVRRCLFPILLPLLFPYSVNNFCAEVPATPTAPAVASNVAMPESLAVSVKAYLQQLGLDKYLSLFMNAGYDDVRVMTRLMPDELKELGIEDEDIATLLSGAVMWQAKAQAAGVLEQWNRMVLRAGEKGIISFSEAQQAGREVEEAQFVMRDAEGRINFKLGDEVGYSLCS